jgi:peptidoglycan/xylan/chitin deacetylase (PgdA/CDA1 family)
MASPVVHAAARLRDIAGQALLRPPVMGRGCVTCHGDRRVRRIALTFDDGPLIPSTLDILAVLADNHVRATFFVVGDNARYAPAVVGTAFEAGHVIGNHSMWHARRSALSLAGATHIDLSEQVICEIIGRRPALYRAPWGWLTPWELKRLQRAHYAVIGWDVDALDWRADVDCGTAIADRILSQIRPGSIILCHDGRGLSRTFMQTELTKALRELLPRLRDEGFELVTVPELLGIPAYREADGRPYAVSMDDSAILRQSRS